MATGILRRFLSVMCLSSLICLAGSTVSEALAPQYQATWKRELWSGVQRQLRYFWGEENLDVEWYVLTPKGVEKRQGWVDCSGFLYATARRAAIPGLQRVTARQMADSRGGWRGTIIDGVRDASECDIFWWSWRDGKRPFGHVGVALESPSGAWGIVHASQSRGYVVFDAFEGKLKRDLVLIKRLDIGDKEKAVKRGTTLNNVIRTRTAWGDYPGLIVPIGIAELKHLVVFSEDEQIALANDKVYAARQKRQ